VKGLYDNVMLNAVELHLATIPQLVVIIVGLTVCAVSVLFHFRRRTDRHLLRSYQLTTLFTLAQTVIYVASLERWIEPTLGTRVLFGSIALLPPLLLSFNAGFERYAPRMHPLEWPMRLACLGVAIAVSLDNGWILVKANPTNGLANLTPGPLYAPFFAICGLGILLALRSVAGTVRGRDRKNVSRFFHSGMLFLVAAGLDVILGVLHWGLPPVTWMGLLALITGFMMNVNDNYQAALRTFRTTAEERDDLYQKLIRDPLTSLYNRSYGIETLEKALFAGELSLIFIDLDDFKSWNDEHGHLKGDEVLAHVAQAIRDAVRLGDIPIRYAGDEFCVVMPNAKTDTALEVAQRILNHLAQIDANVAKRVSASIGVTRARKRDTFASLMNRADTLAYQAKNEGKSRIACDETHPSLFDSVYS
jgi:diguanylate cyclase (GGDEF)-like protein